VIGCRHKECEPGAQTQEKQQPANLADAQPHHQDRQTLWQSFVPGLLVIGPEGLAAEHGKSLHIARDTQGQGKIFSSPFAVLRQEFGALHDSWLEFSVGILLQNTPDSFAIGNLNLDPIGVLLIAAGVSIQFMK